jgi:hypothetical protein
MDLVRTNVSEERIASIITVTRIGELGTMLTVNSDGRRYITNGCLRYEVLTAVTMKNAFF